jgi:Ice-binding-like
MLFSAATVTLDGQGATDAQWIFQVGSALTTATDTSFLLLNGAQTQNVFWAIGSSATIGLSSVFVGNIFAQAAITFGHDSVFVGSALALTAITCESGCNFNLPTISTVSTESGCKGNPPVKNDISNIVDVPLGHCGNFALHAGSTITFDGRQTIVYNGDIGVAPGTSITGSKDLITGTEQTTDSSAPCNSDIQTAYNILAAQTCPADNTFADLTGRTLIPGVYCSASSMLFSAATVTLDGQGATDAQWIFQVGSALTTATGTSFLLLNGAQTQNVFWAIGSSATIGLSSAFVGNIFAQAAITFGHDSVFVGRALALTAITCESGCNFNLPTISTDAACTDPQLIVPDSHTQEPDPIKPVFDPTVYIESAMKLGPCSTYGVFGTVVTLSDAVIAKSLIDPNQVVPVAAILTDSVTAPVDGPELVCTKDFLLNTVYHDALATKNAATTVMLPSELGHQTFLPGTYYLDLITITGAVTLSASDKFAQFLFVTPSDLTTSLGSSFFFLGQARAENVNWAVGGSVTLAEQSSFSGNIVAQGSITVHNDVNINGRLLSIDAVTFGSKDKLELPNSGN